MVISDGIIPEKDNDTVIGTGAQRIKGTEAQRHNDNKI